MPAESRAYLLGGPLDGHTVVVPVSANVLETDVTRLGRYVRVSMFEYDGPKEEPPKVDRWARKRKRNPFPKPRA